MGCVWEGYEMGMGWVREGYRRGKEGIRAVLWFNPLYIL